MNPKLRHAAIPMIAILLLAAVAPGFAAATDGSFSVGVAQDDAGAVTVTVTDNDTAVENATVTVAALNNSSYADEGTYSTDANGTVSLSEPAENVTVEVTATKDNATNSTTVDLVVVEEEREFDSFGQRVSWFVQSLLGDDGGQGGIGEAVSEFVRNHNPSNDNKPDHAGSQNKTNGGGPPDHAGNDKGDDDSDE